MLRCLTPFILFAMIIVSVQAAEHPNSGNDKESKKDDLALTDCPPLVQRTFKKQAKGAAIESVTRDEENDSYLADVSIENRKYGIEVASDGSLVEKWMENEEETVIPFGKCPKAVRKTLQDEADGLEIKEVEKDVQNGVVSYMAEIQLPEGLYSITVAKDGMLIDKNREDSGAEGPDAPKPSPQKV